MANEKRLIDANELKKLVCETCNLLYSDEPCEPSDCYSMEYIDKLPTVDAVEVVHGRWEKYIDDDDDNCCRCTACGWRITYEDCTLEDLGYNYCPNCGAKMDGDGNG